LFHLFMPGIGVCFFFFFQAEDGIRDGHVTGVQTCALPIWSAPRKAHEHYWDTDIRPWHPLACSQALAGDREIVSWRSREACAAAPRRSRDTSAWTQVHVPEPTALLSPPNTWAGCKARHPYRISL